ncbi:MAG: Protein RecA [Turneriella sp.]|nr:Protein RecA [Turneriella sp.]
MIDNAQKDGTLPLRMSEKTQTAAQKAEAAEKAKALDSVLLQIEKQYGKGAIMRMNGDAMKEIPVISTGALSLDLALGVGGVPRGRIIEIYGPESSGKTTLTLHIIAEAQKLGGMAAFIDAEHALDPSYARKLGVDIDELLVAQPDNGEQALEIAESLVRSNALDVIVIDSVAALVPKSEIEGDMGQATMGVQARLMSQALRKLTGAIHKTNTVVIFINQIRMKIGVMFGSPETTTGGNALKFYATVRMDIRRVESLTKGEETIGNHVRVKVVKNKVAPPFRKAEFDIYFNQGISREACIIDEGVNLGVLKKSGTWFSYEDNRLGQGKENVRQYLVENPKIADELEAKVRAAYADSKLQKALAEKEKSAKDTKAEPKEEVA